MQAVGRLYGRLGKCRTPRSFGLNFFSDQAIWQATKKGHPTWNACIWAVSPPPHKRVTDYNGASGYSCWVCNVPRATWSNHLVPCLNLDQPLRYGAVFRSIPFHMLLRTVAMLCLAIGGPPISSAKLNDDWGQWGLALTMLTLLGKC